MLIYDQLGILQNRQTSPIPQTSFLVWTFLVVSYSNTALESSSGILNIYHLTRVQALQSGYNPSLVVYLPKAIGAI